jgi:hypothetical protein
VINSFLKALFTRPVEIYKMAELKSGNIQYVHKMPKLVVFRQKKGIFAAKLILNR